MWNSRAISVATRASVHLWSSRQPQAAGPPSSAARNRASCLIQPAHRTTWTFGGQRSFAARPPAPPPLIGRLRDDPRPVRDLHQADILLIHLRGPQPHALTPGPLSSGQATTIGVPHDPGAGPPLGAIPQPRRQ
jgi:hypothetical protein